MSDVRKDQKTREVKEKKEHVHKDKSNKKSSSKSKKNSLDPKDISPTKQDSGLDKVKKNLASKAATSSLGKKILTKVMDDQSNNLMKAVKKLITFQTDEKKAKEIQNNIIRMLVKSQHQMDAKKISEADLVVVDKPLRKAFRRIIRINEQWNEIKGDSGKLNENFTALQTHLKEIEAIILGVLSPFLSEKNKTKFTATFAFLTDVEFLKKVWSDERSKPEIEKMVKAMTNYLKNPSRAPKEEDAKK